jgi:trimeric autotransporter adhesin
VSNDNFDYINFMLSKKRSMKKIFALVLISFLTVNGFAQNVGIGTTIPSPSAILDVSSTNKGVLLPRVSLTSIGDTLTIPNAALGLIVYNTNVGMTGSTFTDKTGYYVWNGSIYGWRKLVYEWDVNTSLPTSYFSTAGNYVDLSKDVYFGTTTKKPIYFKINNVNFGKFDTSQSIGIGRRAVEGSGGPFKNIGIGDSTLYKNGLNIFCSSGYCGYNIAIGDKAMLNNQSDVDNVAIGYSAGKFLRGDKNVIIGNYALSNLSNGNGSAAYGPDRNVAVGYEALKNNTDGYGNVSVGYQTLRDNDIGVENIAIGNEALSLNISGSQNIAIGKYALRETNNRSGNIAIGDSVLRSNGLLAIASFEGTRNTGVGKTALQQNQRGYNLTAIGAGAIFFSLNGYNNTAVGVDALRKASYDNSNTAVGVASLYYSGASNLVAVGDSALFYNGYELVPDFLNTTKGRGNTAIGSKALMFNTLGYNNTALGQFAMLRNVDGVANIAIGPNALSNNISGSRNVSIGKDAMLQSTDGNGNIAIGNGALRRAEIELNNTIAIGDSALYNNQPTSIASSNGKNNLAIGTKALFTNTYGYSNMAIGRRALYENIGGDGNLAVGDSTMENNTNGLLNTAVGNLALHDNTTGSYNTALGESALKNNTISNRNTGIGYHSLFRTDNDDNTAVGYYALRRNTIGSGNTAVGAFALDSTTNGNENTAIGYRAMYKNKTGERNTSLGTFALESNTNGIGGVAVGYGALLKNTGADGNTAVGGFSLFENVDGYGNTALGNDALTTNVSGDKNTAIGDHADVLDVNLNNTTAIGSYAEVLTSNTMAFGDGNVTKWAFGLTTTSANRAIQVGNNNTNGNGAYLTTSGVWTNISDINKKENIELVDGKTILEKLGSLPISRWSYKGTNEFHIGPMAQDFYAAFKTGLDDVSISTIDPAGVALAAIQEQQKQIVTLKNENDILKNNLLSLLKRIELLEKK